MRIRTQFVATVGLFAAILVVVGVSLIVTNRQALRLQSQEDIAHALELGARELSYLYNDYLLHGESQQRLRWEKSFSSFSRLLADFSPDGPELAGLVHEIKISEERLRTIFAEVAATLENNPPVGDTADFLAMLRVSWSRMELQSQGVAFNASQISQILEEQRNRLQHRRVILLVVLIGLFGAFFIINFMTVSRRILLALTDLQEKTRIIGSGNLQLFIEEGRADEIGDLSRAFNRMTADLRAVTASKTELEQEIRERRRAEEALNRSNQELQQFAYVASHDLQEPLRAIIGFLQLLQDRCGDRVDDKGRHYIERTMKAGHRMQQMIRDLLALSRVSNKEPTFFQVDLNLVVQDILEDLQAIILEKKAEVICGELPNLEVDSGQMRSLFQNLILNGLRYNQTPRPVIEIGSSMQDNVCRLFVRDNGIGISPKFHQRIFMIFQRLHTDREYTGTGMGLALCKKIVERHGGTIWVESHVDEGATFYFSLPRSR